MPLVGYKVHRSLEIYLKLNDMVKSKKSLNEWIKWMVVFVCLIIIIPGVYDQINDTNSNIKIMNIVVLSV